MAPTGDPVADLILRGEAAELDEAEEMYLDRAVIRTFKPGGGEAQVQVEA